MNPELAVIENEMVVQSLCVAAIVQAEAVKILSLAAGMVHPGSFGLGLRL